MNTDKDASSQDDDLGRRAVRGAAVTVIAQGAKILIQVLSVIILARLLSPSDYGLVAMVTAIIGFADIFRDFGLSSAAIQAPNLSREEQTNLFWINTGLGAVLAILAIAVAPLIAAFYGRPELITVTIALSVNFVLNGMATQYRADLNRRMEFRRLAYADVLSPLLGLAAAIVMGLLGYGFVTLIVQQVVQVGTMLLIVVAVARWLPGLYRPRVPVSHFLRFGWRLAGSQVVGYIGANIDTVLLGRRVGAGPLGLYNRAFQLVMTPLGQIRGPLNSVAIPVLSRIQNDERRFGRFVAQGQLLLGYALVAGLALVVGASHPLVFLLLGPEWMQAADVMRLLAIGAGFQTLAYVGYWVYVTKGIVGHLLQYTTFATVLRIVCVLIGSFYGLLGIAFAVAIVPLLSWPLSLWWLSRRAGIPVKELWTGGTRVAIFSVLLGLIAFGAQQACGSCSSVTQLAMASIGWLIGYAALGYLVPPFRADIIAVWSLLRMNLRRSEPE